jgi:release factor glutamine methyltransferase
VRPLSRALDDATRILSATSDTPRLDAELLMAESLGIDRDRLLLDPPQRRTLPARFADMVERRKQGEPVAYITGRRAFWDIELHVGPGVLVPRPDSEILIASAVEHFSGKTGPKRILDLGTGPGTLLLAALDLWKSATGIGIDNSRQALGYAAANARRLGFEDRAELRVGDWADGIDERFDLVLCNPPYVRPDDELGPGVREYEPEEALFAGEDGLDAYRALRSELPRLIAPRGFAAIEIGFDQAEAVTAILRQDELELRLAADLGGRPRALLLWRQMRK